MSAASVRWRRCGGSSLRKGLSSGSASSRASSGGMASWRVSSSVSSCPVTGRAGCGVVALVDGHSAGAGRARGSRGGLAVRHGGALQHQPPLRLMGRPPCADTVAPVDALVDEARFPHPGLAHERHHLPVAGPGPRQGLAQGRQLRVAADKAGQPRATAAWRRCRSALVPTRSKTSTGAVSPLTGRVPAR